jgi:mannosyltransferase OCH1-like enzyme
MIPKIIHYCWLSNDSIPEDLQKYMASWKVKLSGYEFVLWNFDRFDINTSLWVKQAFEARKYASAADFIRLFAVYNYGGIYLDMDIEVVKPFDDLLNTDIMIAHEDNKVKTIEAGCFGAEKGHPYIKACLEHFNGRQFNVSIIEDGYTLPRVMKKIYTESTIFRNMRFYTADYFTVKKFRTGIIKTTENTYAIHHFAGSWFTGSEKRNHKIGQKVVNIFGDTVFSTGIILAIAFLNRIRRYGLFRAIAYYIKKHD